MHVFLRHSGGLSAFAASGHSVAATAQNRPAARLRYRTSILRSLAEAESLWRILEASGDASYFQSYALVAAWAQNIALAFGADWFVLAVLDSATLRPLMLLPLALIRSEGLRIIEAADLGVCDFNAPMVDRRFNPTTEEMAEIWRDAVFAMPRADLIRICKMPETIGACPNPLLKLCATLKMPLANFKTPLRVMGRSWSADMLPEKLRLDLATRRRKLAKRGKLEFRIAATDAEADTFFAAMLEQRASRFKAMGRSDALACPGHQRFYRSLITPAAPHSRACIQALLLDGEPIATGYGFKSHDSFAMIFPTFMAEGWRNYSPGLQLFLESMNWASREGLAYYDFTIGGEAFKHDLGALEYPLYEHVQHLTLRGAPMACRARLKAAIRAHPRLKNAITRALPRALFAPRNPSHAHAQR